MPLILEKKLEDEKVAANLAAAEAYILAAAAQAAKQSEGVEDIKP